MYQPNPACYFFSDLSYKYMLNSNMTTAGMSLHANECGKNAWFVRAAPANGQAAKGTLYEAESWSAIGAFLFGPDPSNAFTPYPANDKQGGKPQIKVGTV